MSALLLVSTAWLTRKTAMGAEVRERIQRRGAEVGDFVGGRLSQKIIGDGEVALWLTRSKVGAWTRG
jgi:hypothetical protein